MRRKGRSSRAAMGIIVIIVMFICVLILVKTEKLTSDLNAKNDVIKQLDASIAAANEKTKTIENEIKYRETDDYIEDQAREALGLRYPDEIILVPKEGSE
ncbi:MAG: septum formation initiator family protein [Lachnospiraceae bacterium]|nr:septum formation initiator family protein [Lachnospiraceae bacterium]MBO7633619.1 septum formation initiator family protein [Lachnospiraceae bacterium]MBP5652856.1 septum formation initiator family protein [Lachnospiraceae bacterium]